MKITILMLLINLISSKAARAGAVTEFLRAFHSNPAKMMERLPSKVENGTVISRGDINRRALEKALPQKLELRGMIMDHAAKPFNTLQMDPAEGAKDRPERIIDPGTIRRNIRELDAQGLTRAKLDPAPWADSYWPTYKGAIGIRYADKHFPNSKDWSANHAYILANPAASIAAYGNPSAVDALSPAEKYDLALGDSSFTLTEYAWNRGLRVYEESGAVPTWVGFCHGWSAAAHMGVPIPKSPINVTAANGTQLTFYPQDVKALQSFLWANASPTTRFMGTRCNLTAPQRDAFGRIVDPLCWDTNPASWHIAVTNQIGSNHRSLVIDSTFDYQVWNYPVAKYQYRYFNPQTWQETSELNSALIPVGKFKIDKFKKYRSPAAQYILGIYMDVSHVSAINPTRAPIGEPPLNTLRFIYDLELDADLNIVGGEWYSNAHPDFVWTFDPGAQATSVSDPAILNDVWNTSEPVPASWADYAKRASLRGEPLFAFLRQLTLNSTPSSGGSSPELAF